MGQGGKAKTVCFCGYRHEMLEGIPLSFLLLLFRSTVHKALSDKHSELVSLQHKSHSFAKRSGALCEETER